MINSTKQLNEIVRSISKENAQTSVSQLVALIDQCAKAGVRFSIATNYTAAFSAFVAKKIPEWQTSISTHEIESLTMQGKIEEAACKRDETNVFKKEIHKQFRLEQYGTADWFIEKSTDELFCCPTEIAIIDNLITEYCFK